VYFELSHLKNTAPPHLQLAKTIYATTPSLAISAWLSLAKTWNDFYIFKDDIENAFLYWYERSNADDKGEV